MKANLGCATTDELLNEIRKRLQSVDMPSYRSADNNPPEESSSITINRAEAKPPLPTVSENAMAVTGMISAVISELHRENPDAEEYIGMLRAIQCSEAMHDLERYKPPSETSPLAQKLLNIFDKMSMKPAGDLLQSIMVLSYLCHDLGYDLSIKRPYNTTRWHVTASQSNENEIIETASSPHLPDAVRGLRDLLVEDSESEDVPAVAKKNAVEANKAAESLVLVKARKALEKTMVEFERAATERALSIARHT